MAEEFPLKALYGGKIASATRVAEGMKQVESSFDASFKDHTARHAQEAERMEPIRALLGERILGDAAQESVRGLAQLDGRMAKRQLGSPDVDVVEQRIYTGSVGAIVPRPFNYQWTWNAQTEGGLANVAANRTTGQEGFTLYNNSNSAHAWGAVAVGIYFRPMTTNGILHVWSTPAFNYFWFTYSVLSSSHSDGWLGLNVGRYTMVGAYDGSPVNQQVSLWNDNSWWSGAGSHSGSNSGFPLSAWLAVDNAHWYAIWVWAGGSVFGNGWSTFSGSAAYANLQLTVPSIGWELF